MTSQDRQDEAWVRSGLEPVRRRVARWLAEGLGRRWVVAVSGGSDSVGLLRALDRLASSSGLTLSVAHLDHGARGEASRADAAFVAALAESLGLPFDMGHWKPERPGHFEVDARRYRYEWLAEIARVRGASVVAVGHTRDDQAETILHRLVRGTGIRGLAGMPSRRVLARAPEVTLVRPLLSVSRETLRRWLADLGQPFREDATNEDRRLTRARIRHDLLPRLERDYNPRVVDAILRLGKLAAASEQALERTLIELEQTVVLSADRDRVVLHRDRFLQLPVYSRIELLRRLWRNAGWPEREMSARRWLRLASLARGRGTTRMPVGEGIEASVAEAAGADHPAAYVLTRVGMSRPASIRQGVPEAVELDSTGLARWWNGVIQTVADPDAARDETIDLDRVAPPLHLRAPAPGDRFDPLGMGGKTRALNDFFRSRHVSRDQRVKAPLLCDANGIVWVVGHRIADRVKVTENTRRTLGLRWEVCS